MNKKYSTDWKLENIDMVVREWVAGEVEPSVAMGAIAIYVGAEKPTEDDIAWAKKTAAEMGEIGD